MKLKMILLLPLYFTCNSWDLWWLKCKRRCEGSSKNRDILAHKLQVLCHQILKVQISNDLSIGILCYSVARKFCSNVEINNNLSMTNSDSHVWVCVCVYVLRIINHFHFTFKVSKGNSFCLDFVCLIQIAFLFLDSPNAHPFYWLWRISAVLKLIISNSSY